MAEVLELQTNIPQIIALAYADGKTFPSKIQGAPDQVMFTLTNGMRVFWPEPFANTIKAAGIAAREQFEVCKREIAKGRTQFQIRRLDEAPAAAPPRVTAPARAPEPPPPAWDEFRDRGDAYEAPAPPALPANRVTTQSARMMACFLAAIDAVQEAQQYSTRKGLGITFTSDNITSAALSCYISECKGGR